MKNSESKIPEIIFNNVANLTGYWRFFGLNMLIMKSDMRLTMLGISLNPVNRSLNSEHEGPQQYIKIFNSSIGILKTTSRISIFITNCFTIGSNTTYKELENSTLNISNSVFHNVSNNHKKYPGLIFIWGNSKVTIQDTIIKPFKVLAVIINHSEVHLKNVTFRRRGNLLEWFLKDEAVISSYNSSVIRIDTCYFADFNVRSIEHGRRNWTFATLNGNLFSNKCDTKKISVRSHLDTFTACTFKGTENVPSYFEDTVIEIYNSTFIISDFARASFWVSKHSKLIAYNVRFRGLKNIGILGTESQIKAVKYQGGFESPEVIIAVQDSNVSIQDYNIWITGLLSFVNSYAVIENSIITGTRSNYYGGAIFASGSMLHIDNSTFSNNLASNGLDKSRNFDMYLTNSTVSGMFLQLGGIMITNYSFINIRNSEVVICYYAHKLLDHSHFSIFVTNNSTAYFTSTLFVSGKQLNFDDLLEYDRNLLNGDYKTFLPSMFLTCNSSSIVLDGCNFFNTTEFRIYLSSSITFLNTNFENNAGIYEVADDSFLQFEGCSLLRGAENVFANNRAVVTIKNSSIAYGRSKFTLLNKSFLRLLKTSIYNNTFGNFIVSQLQSTIIISNCLYSNNSRIKENNIIEINNPLSNKVIKSMAAGINDTTSFINI